MDQAYVLSKHYHSQTNLVRNVLDISSGGHVERSFESSTFAKPSLFQAIPAEVTKIESITHKNLLPFRVFSSDGNLTVLRRNFVNGKSICEILSETGSFSVGECFKQAIIIAETLLYLHDHGIICCSLKPENVIIREGGEAILVDYGIGSIWYDTVDHSQVPYFCAYLGPEGLKSEPVVSFELDVYHFGLLLYAMFNGQYPWQKCNIPKLMRDVVSGSIQCSPDVPRGIQDLISDMLLPEPSKRPKCPEIVSRLRWLQETSDSEQDRPLFNMKKSDSLRNLGAALLGIEQKRAGVPARKSGLTKSPSMKKGPTLTIRSRSSTNMLGLSAGSSADLQ